MNKILGEESSLEDDFDKLINDSIKNNENNEQSLNSEKIIVNSEKKNVNLKKKNVKINIKEEFLLENKESEKKVLGNKELYDSVLKKYYGYESTKIEQFEIIYNIINNKKDVCAILATGFGKSICYQLPVLICKKSVIVICPLIALMNEQSEQMRNINLPVCVFNGDSSYEEKNFNESELLNGNYMLIYMTPEYFIKSEKFIKTLNKNNNLLMVCIDEAHAVSTWGLDFRPSYTKLGIIREWVNVPILTLTATASFKVKEDIKNILQLNDPFELTGNFDRPNLYITALPRKETKNIMEDIGPLIEKYKNDYIIIYCKTREETEKVAEIINNYGIECYAYHAGLNTNKRNDTQQKFNDGNYKCIVATIAFGMGINIPNVRLVIHYNCPKNMESYYQEIGRAGRDGKPSECYLFYSNKDFLLNRYFLKNMTNLEYKKYQEDQIRLIEKYVYTTDCRRKIILQSFNQVILSCNNCDNCIKKKKIKLVDYSKHIYLFLSLLKRIDDKFGMNMLISTLLGKKQTKDYLKKMDEFGKGIILGNEDWWKLFSRLLLNEDLIIEKQLTGLYGSTISVTSKGSLLINELKNKYSNYSEIILDNDNKNCLLQEIIVINKYKGTPKHKNIILESLGLNMLNIDEQDLDDFIGT